MLLNWPTTEYKLEYKSLSLDLRKKIWQDNLKLRESCAENNRVDHFWVYQIRNESNKPASNEIINVKTQTTNISSDLRVTNGTQYDLTKDDSHKNYARSDQPIQLKSALKSTSVASHDDDVNSEQVKLKSALKTNYTIPKESILKNEERVDSSDQQIDLKSDLKIAKCNLYDTTSKDVAIQTPHWQNKKRFVDNPSKKKNCEPCFSSNFANKRFPKHASPSKIIPQEEKTPFAPYGWADSEKNVGSKRTFNINASAVEVYPSALHALSSRRELRRQLQDANRKRPSTAPLLSPVNHSSLWMTEYQDVFSRPQSAPFVMTKAVRWH